MDVLVLTDGYPFPIENGQALRIFHYVRLLRRRHNFDLMCTADGAPPEPVRALFRNVAAVPHPAAVGRSSLARLCDAFSIDGLVPRNPALETCLRVRLAQTPYDIVWVSGDAALAALPPEVSVPILGDLVDDGVLALARNLRRTDGVLSFLKTLKRGLLVALYERRHFGRADRCLLVSEIDARWFRRLCPRTPTDVIHNGVDAEFFAPMAVSEDPCNLVFEGNLAFGPNSDAVVHFCRAILPRIRRELPGVTFTVVGKNPPAEVRALACDHVAVTGFVEDIRPHVARAAVFVSPLRKGAGIKNKLLQAWAMGKATVATEASSGGLAVQDGVNICIRSGPAEFSAAVVSLLRDPARRQALGQAARRTILQRYTWQRQADELEALMRDMAGVPRGRPTYAKSA